MTDRDYPSESIDQINEPSSISPKIARLLNASEAISSAQKQEIGFLHSTLCQTSLPYKRNPIDLRYWERANGRASIRLEAGSAFNPATGEWVPLSLPFGTKARLALIHLGSEAVRAGSPSVEIERSMTAFARKILRRAPNSRDLAALKTQLASLVACTIRLSNGAVQVNARIVEGFELCWLQSDGKRILWPRTINLSPEYWESLRESAVPLDMRAVAALSHSAMALDIYTWLAQRLCRVEHRQFIPWSALYAQFGSDFSRIRDFRRKFILALRCVLTVYPHANLQIETGKWDEPFGLALFPSKPAIPRNR